MRKMYKTLIAAAAIPLTAVITTIGASPAAAGQYSVNPCVEGGPTKKDNKLAEEFNKTLEDDLAGHMDGYRVTCAKAVIDAVQERDLGKHAAEIAITTSIVETHLQNINIEVDHDSLGLFQQRAHWGSAGDRLDPEWATDAFLDEMLRMYHGDSWKDGLMGDVSQAVQRSAYPDRYQPMTDDAETIVDKLW
ncbi:DUF4179 domain-containing protein [Streptomonospora litoralis]|uniref:Uncharacterized protein n=1 Tax=Streptomonospora litoralis TaxID=2498135 RepID=A0A4P6Q6U6_9ACTN|nr:DUF4179 domain-containing protein [Streptomonospora litoralis]QBI56455.1 hypothetical protein EKD16_23540 [Streptomonospora litoralis]